MTKSEQHNSTGRFEIVCDRKRLLDHLKEKGFFQLTNQDLKKSGFDVQDFGKDNLIFSHKQFGSIKGTRLSQCNLFVE